MKLRPRRYSFSAFGGPRAADIDIAGNQDDIFTLLSYLRNPITLYDNIATARWWGYIESVKLAIGAVEFDVSMSSMSNSIVIAYTDVNTYRQVTDAAENAHSLGVYGRKELFATINATGRESAEEYRDELLSTLAYPIAQTKTTNSDKIGGSITAAGWWATMGWRAYNNGNGLAGCREAVPDTDMNLGDIANNTKLAHYFYATGWDVMAVLLQISVEGTPTDSVRVSLYDDNGSQSGPGSTQKAYVDVAAADLGNFGAAYFEFASLTALESNYHNWIVLERTGALSATNYYKVAVATEEILYPGNTMRYNGSTWSWPTPPSNIVFKVVGGEYSNVTIEHILEDLGQFVNQYKVEATLLPGMIYRDGYTDGLTELAKLMGPGVKNGRRLVSYVDQYRTVRVYEEPAYERYRTNVFLHGDGTYRDRGGNRIEHECPTGWVQFRDVFPTSLDTSNITLADAFYIEESEYDADTGRLTVRPRATRDVWDVGGFTV